MSNDELGGRTYESSIYDDLGGGHVALDMFRIHARFPRRRECYPVMSATDPQIREP